MEREALMTPLSELKTLIEDKLLKSESKSLNWQIPEHDVLEFVLGKLPAKHVMSEGDIVELTLRKENNIIPAGVRYLAYYAAPEDADVWCNMATTLTEAATKLLITLIREGVVEV
jgi:hypothetical protein